MNLTKLFRILNVGLLVTFVSITQAEEDNELLSIIHFSGDNQNVASDGLITLNWHTQNANNIYIISNQGHGITSTLAQGEQEFSISEMTLFTLTAQGDSGSKQVSLMVVPEAEHPDFSQSPEEDVYTQPLLELVLSENTQMQPIERALLTTKLDDDSSLNIVPQYDNQLDRVSDDGVSQWSVTLNGIVAHAPLYLAATKQVFFSVSSSDGTGELCRINPDGTELICLTHKPDGIEELANLVIPPLVHQGKLYVFDIKGYLYQITPDFGLDNFTVFYPEDSEAWLAEGDAIVTPAAVHTQDDQLVFTIRTRNDDIKVVALPSETLSLSRMLDSVKSWFISEEIQTSTVKPLEVEWSVSLSQQGGQ